MFNHTAQLRATTSIPEIDLIDGPLLESSFLRELDITSSIRTNRSYEQIISHIENIFPYGGTNFSSKNN